MNTIGNPRPRSSANVDATKLTRVSKRRAAIIKAENGKFTLEIYKLRRANKDGIQTVRELVKGYTFTDKNTAEVALQLKISEAEARENDKE